MRRLQCGAALLALLAGADGFKVKDLTKEPPLNPDQNEELVLQQLMQFTGEEMMLHMEWVPGTEQVITAHKAGRLRLYESVEADVEDYVELIDMRADVWSFGDHGITTFQFHPDFEGPAGSKYLYVLYTGEVKDVRDLPNNKAVAPLRLPAWGKGPPGTNGNTWLDVCPSLDTEGTGKNHFGNICEHPYYIDRLILDLDAAIPTATKDITLLDIGCAASSTHGPGSMMTVGTDLVYTVGDGSQFAEFDPGFADADACFKPGGGKDQGQFRAQRLDYGLGKLTRIPAALLDSPTPLTIAQLKFIGIGLRNPYQSFYDAAADEIWIGDVGYGDAGSTERIFKATDVSKVVAATKPINYGWPCIEGVRDNAQAPAGEYLPWSGESQIARKAYTVAQKIPICNAIYASVDALVSGKPSAKADPMWQAPLYEYRVGLLDPEYPKLCLSGVAAITSIFRYTGDSMPAEYTNKIIFSDYAKQCVFYFENDAAGNPDMTTKPHILFAGNAFVNMRAGPDGFVYALDYHNLRLVRMYAEGRGPNAGGAPTRAPTPAPTFSKAPTPAPYALPTDIPAAEICHDANAFPELEWQRADDGSYSGTLTLGAAVITTSRGTMRTRTWNGMVPGPVMRMKACNTYNLKVVNDLGDWPDVRGANNRQRDPMVTNIHTHGLHISGMAPADDVFTTVAPGESGDYVYVMPCDHTGGTNWYHPHHHGSTALQTNAGAAGMIVVDSNAREANDMPPAYQAMPEQMIVFQEFNPVVTAQYADVSGDELFVSDIPDAFILANGCEELDVTVEDGQWVRLHLLNVGIEFNSLISILPVGKAAACDLQMLSKDGVWVAAMPRPITKNVMFMSVSSRLDVAIRCTGAGDKHSINYQNVAEFNAGESPTIMGSITVAKSTRAAAADLPVWKPCRPGYLTDLTKLTTADLAPAFPLDVRETINGQAFITPDEYILTMNLNKAQDWVIGGDDVHPMHVHINHMQFTDDLTPANQWPSVPDWVQAGDWVDTMSFPGIKKVRVRPHKFTGRQVLHCHIAQHSDLGVIAVMNIRGTGGGPLESPAIAAGDYGTCPVAVPASTPFGGTAAAIPGAVEAEGFDLGGEGIAYHNINIDTNTASAARLTEAVEIRKEGTATYVSEIKQGEWLKYSVAVGQIGFYTMSLTAASTTPDYDLAFTVWQDAVECPARSQKEGLLAAVDAQITGAEAAFSPYLVPTPLNFAAAGAHTFTVCFDAAAPISLDSFTFEYCGATADSCNLPVPDNGTTETAISAPSAALRSNGARSATPAVVMSALFAVLLLAAQW